MVNSKSHLTILIRNKIKIIIRLKILKSQRDQVDQVDQKTKIT